MNDPSEEEILEVPTSDPYEEVLIPGFSQRDETREEVEALIESLLEKGRQRMIRRAELEAAAIECAELEAATATVKRSELEAAAVERAEEDSRTVRGVARSPSPSPPVHAKRIRVACATCSDDRIDLNVDLELLQLRCADLEEEHDRVQDEMTCLRQEIAKIQSDLHQYKVSASFFQKETGRWRWAAAHASTCLDSAMHEFGAMMDQVSSTRVRSAMRGFGVKMVEVSDVLRNPARA